MFWRCKLKSVVEDTSPDATWRFQLKRVQSHSRRQDGRLQVVRLQSLQVSLTPYISRLTDADIDYLVDLSYIGLDPIAEAPKA